MDSLEREVIDSVVRSLNSGKVMWRPWRHVRFDNLLPDLFATRLASMNLPSDIFKPSTHPGQLTSEGDATRHVCDLDEIESCNFLPDDWVILNRVLKSHVVRDVIFRKAGIPTGAYCDPNEYEVSVAAIHDFPGYEIRPHADTNAKLVTFQLYFPEIASRKDMPPVGLGTELYRYRREMKRNVHLHKLYSSIPYVFNSAWCFKVTRRTIHGRTATKHNRSHVMLTYYKPGGIEESKAGYAQ